PGTPLDENNSYMAGVMAHEMVHVIRNHVVNRDSFRKALQAGGTDLTPDQFQLTTRMGEIEADREGLLYMLAAGYNPNAMVEWMERAARDIGDPPPAVDHPTFDERVSFLLDFWTNEVRFAWQAFETGTDALEQAAKLEQKDLVAARKSYDVAIVELDRYTRFFRTSKEAWNNLAIAQAKIGVIEQGDKSPLSKWYTPLSIERNVAQKLPPVKRRADKVDVVFLERARDSLNKAIELDPKYGRALINLAAVQTGLKEFQAAEKTLVRAKAAGADKVLVSVVSGILAAEQGKWPDAVAAFTEARKSSGDHPRALYCLALALQNKGDKEEAKKVYSEFIAKEQKGSPWAAIAQMNLSGLGI
ncbi:MAG: tetratricopeptide repeat protein, partial [Deltaproteobacteria bacterium]|nr:tetratricopeptide repeat protein [Deltaproteobacteria bacterium]